MSMIRARDRRPVGAADGGFVLVPVIGVLMLVAFISLFLTNSSTGAVERVERRVEDVRLEAIADAAIDLTMQRLWSAYQVARGEDPTSLFGFRSFLDGRDIRARAHGSAAGDSEFDILGQVTHEEPEWVDVLSLSGLPTNAGGGVTLDGARVHAVEVLRQDALEATALRARAVVSFGEDLPRRYSREVERVYFVGGELFRGFDFALLANNVNCIMCHATVDSVDRYYNRDLALRGTFERVRVGTLESLKIRSGSAQSSVAGALYTRGPVMDKSGTILTSLSGSSLNSAKFDGEGNLLESSTGLLTSTSFVNATGDPLPALANLYLNYPRDQDKQVDGPFPEEFPAVIPDLNGNRTVDDDEYLAVADRAGGTLSGGRKVAVAAGAAYASPGLPAFDQVASLTGSISGNLVAYGTSTDPLVIDGRVTVDGDVVIGGVVRGSGELIARGNTYIVGDLTYADGVNGSGYRTFGVAQDGTTNRLTLGAGGNVLVNDFLRGKSASDGVTGDNTGDFNFTLSETMLFAQMEWIRTQPTVTTSGSSRGSTVTVANPVYEPGYVPRYYVIRPENPVAIFNKSDTYFDVNTLTWLGKEHLGDWNDGSTTYLPVGSAERAASVALSLVPASGWLDDAQLMAMWDAAEASHSSGPYRLDAFLYTNNAIFLVVKKSSDYGGQALINGGLVGADLGILVAGGLQLNYDDRHQDVIKLRESKKGELELVRGARLR